MALDTQRIHGLIPLCDLSLTQLHSACLLRTASLHRFFFMLNTLFSPPISLCLPHFSAHSTLSQSPLLCSRMICRSSVPSPPPPLCLCQLARLYCNGVPAVDKCRLCSLLPIDRDERRGEASDWSARVLLTHFPYSFAPSQPIDFLSLTWHVTIWPDLMTNPVKILSICYYTLKKKQKTIYTLKAHTGDVLASSINFKQTPQSLNAVIRPINFVSKCLEVKNRLIHTKTRELLKPGDVEGSRVFSSLFKILSCI